MTKGMVDLDLGKTGRLLSAAVVAASISSLHCGTDGGAAGEPIARVSGTVVHQTIHAGEQADVFVLVEPSASCTLRGDGFEDMALHADTRGVVTFFVASEKVGPWPMAMLFRAMPLMLRSAKTTQAHKRDLLEDVKANRAGDALRASSVYLDYIAEDDDVATRLAASGNRTWVVHAEKGDGGLTDAERTTLEAAPNVTLVVLPGAVFFLPDEAPRQIAEVIAAAVAQVT